MLIISGGVSAAHAQMVHYISADYMLDVESGELRADPLITSQDGKIISVEIGVKISEGDPRLANGKLLVLRGILMPGMIDMHVHLDGRPEYGGYSNLRFSDRFWTAIAVANAQKMLRAGFTTVRNLGADQYNVVGVDQAIEEGWIIGPRIINAAHSLGASGGHCDQTFLPPSYAAKSPAVGDGAIELRQRVREQRKYGAEVIKVCATGGVFSRNTEPGQQQLSLEELTAIAEEAHLWGIKVAAHAHGAAGIKAAILAGIDTIEHVSLVDDEGIRLAKERGTWFSMDVFNTEYTQSEGKKNGVLEENLRKDREIAQIQRDNFRKAHRAGVKMVFGSDAGVMPHESAAGQFRVMTEYGMTPIEAIRAATVNAADALGMKDELGVIAPGAHADMILLAENPLDNIEALEQVLAVIKQGELVQWWSGEVLYRLTE